MNQRSAISFFCLLTAASGCALLTPKHSLKPQLEEVRSLKSSLDEEWNSAMASFESTLQEMETFSAQQIDPEKVDVRVVRESILGGDDSGEAARSAVEAVTSGESLDLEVVDAANQTIALGQTIYANLTTAVPELLSGFGDHLTDAGAEIVRIGAEAEAMSEIVDDNVLMSDAEKQEFHADHQALEGELVSMQDIVSKMLEDSSELGTRLTAAQERFQTELDTAFDNK